MRFLIPVIGVVVLVGLGTALSDTAEARPVAASVAASAAAAVDGGSGAASATGARIGDGRMGPSPDWFGGKWWKKLMRGLKRFLEFIDGLIDDLRNHPGDEPGGRYAALEGPARRAPGLAGNRAPCSGARA